MRGNKENQGLDNLFLAGLKPKPKYETEVKKISLQDRPLVIDPDTGKRYRDITDLVIDIPNICTVPDWKLELEDKLREKAAMEANTVVDEL